MSLLTLERSSPSPQESESEDLLSNSSYEGFVARDHYALCLSPRPFTSLGPGRTGDSLRIFAHLKKLVKLLRSDDKLRMAVELENNGLRKVTKYLVIITTNGHVDTEETIILGTEQEGSTVRICLVVALWRDTEIKLDGDGGFSVHTGDRHQVFKPSSVQSMWAALQMMYKATNDAQSNNYYVGGLSHTWMSYYTSMLTSDGMILNEWNLMEDVESFRPDYGSDVSNWSDENIALEKVLTTKLREVMLHQDLEEVTCKQLRLLLEEQMNMDLTEYRGFLDQQMLRILGQMERPSQIFDYLYLGSEWNASNLQELKEIGVKYILNISREIDNFYPEEFKYLNIRLYDLPNSELMKHWDKTYSFLKEAKSSGKKALVHCKMGISRSAATVVAYTMKEYKMSLEDAVRHVKSKRSIVNPNDGFMNQLKAYEGILKARHNELWGKMAPSRPHPIALYRARSRSEPNIPDMFNQDEPELSFLEEGGGGGGRGHHHGDGDILHASCNHLDLPRLDERETGHAHAPPSSQGGSCFPPQSTPIDKTENIRNFLASLPNVTIEDDPGFADNICGTSESGSGYSSPISSPTTEDEHHHHHHHHRRYNKLAKEIRRECREYRETLISAAEPSSHPQPGKEEEEEEEGEGTRRGGASSNQNQRRDSGEEGMVLGPLESSPPKFGSEAVRTTSSARPDSERPDASFPTTTTAATLIERLHPVAHIPIFSGIPKPLRATSLPRNIVAMYQQHLTDTVDAPESLVAEQGSTANVSEIPSESNYAPSVSPSEQSNQQQQQRVSRAVEMDASGPIIELPQIHSVPERIKEIEEMHSLKSMSKSPTVYESNLVSPAERKEDAVAETAAAAAAEEEGQGQQSGGGKGEDGQNSLSRASSGHSISSSLSAGDEELKQLEREATSPSRTPPPSSASQPTATSTTTMRHASLSPNPTPLLQLRQGLADTDSQAPRAASCSHLSQLTEPVIRTSSAVAVATTIPVNAGVEEVAQFPQQLGSGAVKARVMDIERNRDEKSTSTEELLLLRRQSPPYQPRSASSSEVVLPPTTAASAPSYEARDLKQIVAFQCRRPSSDIITTDRPLPSAVQPKTRRESTPPAFLSAWSSLVDEVPTAPVQDLKKKFEEPDSVSLCSSVGSSSGAGGGAFKGHTVRQKVKSGNLRRTQSLKSMELPTAKVRHRFRMGGKSRTKFPSGGSFSSATRMTSPYSQD